MNIYDRALELLTECKIPLCAAKKAIHLDTLSSLALGKPVLDFDCIANAVFEHYELDFDTSDISFEDLIKKKHPELLNEFKAVLSIEEE